MKCTKCFIEKDEDEFYYNKKLKRISSRKCKECHRKDARDRSMIEMETTGSKYCYANPDHYFNDTQRKIIYNILTSMDWKFNKENGIWYKLPIKDENGIFTFKQNYLSKEKGKTNQDLIDIELDNKVGKLRDKGWTYKMIAKKLNISITNVFKRVTRYNASH